MQNIHKYIYDIHKQFGHRNHNSIREELKKRHIYFKGIYSTIKKVCLSCGICNIKIKTKIAKREKAKLIIFNKPRSRYIVDITDIPTEIRANTNYLYLLNIVDHFTKYANSYLLSNKNQNSILNCIKNFIEDVGEPIEMGFDNGREFLNRSVSSYLTEKNIKIVNGRPYNPRSQGAVERIHVTIRRELISKFLENINNFNLEESLKKTITNYNRIKHRVTKYSPIEVFFSNEKTLFENVYKNTLDFYINSQKNSIVYNDGDLCLMENNIMITSKKYDNKYYIIEKNKIKKNKSFVKIVVEIKNNLCGGSYLVKILQNNNIYNLKKNSLYDVNFNILRKCERSLIDYILNYNNNNNNTDLIKENDDDKIDTSDSESEDLDEVDKNKKRFM